MSYKDNEVFDKEGKSIGVKGSLGPGPGPIGMPEPARERDYRVENLQIIAAHPDFWGPVLQAMDSEGRVMIPTWRPLEKNAKLPIEARVPVSKEILQGVFDQLWQQGYRPTGTTVVLESVAEPFPAELKKQMDYIAGQMSSHVGDPHHYFKEYWGEGDRNTAVLWRDSTEEGSLYSIAVKQFDSLDQIFEYVLKWNIQRCTGYSADPQAGTDTEEHS